MIENSCRQSSHNGQMNFCNIFVCVKDNVIYCFEYGVFRQKYNILKLDNCYRIQVNIKQLIRRAALNINEEWSMLENIKRGNSALLSIAMETFYLSLDSTMHLFCLRFFFGVVGTHNFLRLRLYSKKKD
jgi:hypothetical protein